MSSTKKIVILGTAYPFRGGLAAYNERLARAYQERGDEVVIYTFSLQYPGFLFPGKTQYSSGEAPEDLSIKVRVNSVNPLNWWRVGKEIRALRPDVMIVKFWIPFMAPALGTIARVVRKNKHTRIISIIDNIIPHEKRAGDRLLAKYWVGSVDAFVVMARAVEQELRQFTTSKPVRFNPHPIYDNFGERVPKQEAKKLLGLDTDTSYVLFFGFIRDYKGLDLLLQAMAESKIRDLGIKLIVAGEFYTDKTPYLKLIEELNLKDRIVLRTDFIPDAEVGKYFCASDVVVQPYKTATQSGVTQIAYHFEKPIITTDVGGLAEIVVDGRDGYVVQPEVGTLRDAIFRFFNEKKEEEMVEYVKMDKSRFSWQKLLENIDNLLAE